MKNRLWNVSNPYQGDRKKVLCVCSAGLLRSPTAAVILASEFERNTRAAGLDVDHALIPVDQVLLSWADEVVCMTKDQMYRLSELFEEYQIAAPQIVCLNIPDNFGYMDEELRELIFDRYAESIIDAE